MHYKFDETLQIHLSPWAHVLCIGLPEFLVSTNKLLFLSLIFDTYVCKQKWLGITLVQQITVGARALRCQLNQHLKIRSKTFGKCRAP